MEEKQFFIFIFFCSDKQELITEYMYHLLRFRVCSNKYLKIFLVSFVTNVSTICQVLMPLTPKIFGLFTETTKVENTEPLMI